MPENEKHENENEVKKEPAEKENVDIFLEAAKKVKEETVSKAEFDKVQETNKKLTQFIVEGGENPLGDQTKVEKRTKADLVKVLESEDTNNYEYAKASLELRKLVIDEGGRDPFLPNSSQQPITSTDVEGAEKVAKVLQDCVDEANGDPETFNFLFGKRVNDSSAILNAKVRKARG